MLTEDRLCLVMLTEDRLCFVLLCLQKIGFVLFCCAYRRQAFVCFVVPTEDTPAVFRVLWKPVCSPYKRHSDPFLA